MLSSHGHLCFNTKLGTVKKKPGGILNCVLLLPLNCFMTLYKALPPCVNWTMLVILNGGCHSSMRGGVYNIVRWRKNHAGNQKHGHSWGLLPATHIYSQIRITRLEDLEGIFLPLNSLWIMFTSTHTFLCHSNPDL